MVNEKTHYTVNIMELVPAGNDTVLIRLRPDDLSDVRKAAPLVGMNQSELIRTSVVQAARQIIAEEYQRRQKELANVATISHSRRKDRG